MCISCMVHDEGMCFVVGENAILHALWGVK